MATWTNGGNTNYLRKMLFGSVYAIDYTGGSSLTALVTSIKANGLFNASGIGSLSPFASGNDLGTTTDDGVTFAASVDGDDVTVWQSRESARHDITSDVSTAQFMCLETRASVLNMYYNLAFSNPNAAVDAASGFNLPKPQAGTVYRSMLFLGVDTAGVAGEAYGAVLYPKCSVTDKDDIQWHPGDPVQYSLTVTAYPDPAQNNVSAFMAFGGPGWPGVS